MKLVAPISHIQPLVTMRRQRLLPAEGPVIVKIGDVVKATDVVARSGLGARHRILDAARALGISPKKAKGLIQRSIGEQVEAGAIIAGRRGVGNRQLRAPVAGQVVAISEAQVLLQISDESSLLKARVPGEVIDIALGRGVTIECECAWVQGFWGNGNLNEGILHKVGDSHDQFFTADQIDMSQRGSILVAGVCKQRQALELAAQVPIRGLVLGSLATRLIPLAKKLSYPIVLIEGFGQTAMNVEAFRLLSSHKGEQATLNAQPTDPTSGDRPEVIIPVKESGRPPQPVPVQGFQVGKSIRVLAGADRGKIGRITALLPSSTYYQSGLHAPGASINIENQDSVAYPLANLELIV